MSDSEKASLGYGDGVDRPGEEQKPPATNARSRRSSWIIPNLRRNKKDSPSADAPPVQANRRASTTVSLKQPPKQRTERRTSLIKLPPKQPKTNALPGQQNNTHASDTSVTAEDSDMIQLPDMLPDINMRLTNDVPAPKPASRLPPNHPAVLAVQQKMSESIVSDGSRTPPMVRNKLQIVQSPKRPFGRPNTNSRLPATHPAVLAAQRQPMNMPINSRLPATPPVVLAAQRKVNEMSQGQDDVFDDQFEDSSRINSMSSSRGNLRYLMIWVCNHCNTRPQNEPI
jgi:hypothetical protein